MPTGRKLRARWQGPPFQVVLVEPEIPPNTGSVARTCAATGSALHLVGPLGFRTDEQAVRRAGLDYWHLVNVHRHASMRALTQTLERAAPEKAAATRQQPDAQGPDAQGPGAASQAKPRLHLFASSAQRSYLEADFAPGDALVFGKESVGLSRETLAAYPERVWAIPTLGAVRSLNLSNAVSIVLFEALRRCGALSDTYVEK